MDSAEKVFRLCLKQDLQRLHRIITDIPTGSAQEEITSWFFPTKTYKFVDEFITQNNIFENGSERLFLELIIDRIHVGIKLILTQIQDNYLGKFVFSPKQVTLGCLFESLYRGISNVKIMKSYRIVAEDKVDRLIMIHKEAQTDIIALNKCDSCASAIECMKGLMKLFDQKEFENFNFGKRFKPQILDVTQFGCMLQITTSVMDSFKQLTGNIYRNRDGMKNFKKENERLVSENMNTKRRIEQLEEEVKVYKQEYEKSSSKFSLLSYENEELNRFQVQNELRINSLRNTVDNLNKGLGKKNISLDKVTREKNNLMKDLDMYSKNQKLLVHTVVVNEKRMEKICQDISYLAENFLEVNKNLDSLTTKLQNISKLNESTKMRVSNLIEEVINQSDDLSQNIENFKKNLKNKLTEIIMKSADETKAIEGFQIKGNPVEDISQQIKENEIKIRGLQVENEKLNNILMKFERLRTGS